MAKCSSSAILPCMVSPQPAAAAAGHTPINLNTADDDAMSLSPRLARALDMLFGMLLEMQRHELSRCHTSRRRAFTMRQQRSGCADEPTTQSYFGVARTDRAHASQLHAAVARHIFHLDLSHKC